MRGQMAHLDPEVLAEFDAGLITGRRGAQISAHLAACEQCTALGEQLAGVSALLMAAPAATMPDRLAGRLDTVLAAEIARRDQTEGAAAQLGGAGTQPAGAGARLNGDGARLNGDGARPDRNGARPDRNGARPDRNGAPDHERRRWPAWHRNLRPLALRVLAPVAVIALIVAGALELTPQGSTSSQASSSAASPANRSAAGGPAAAQSSSAASGATGANRPVGAPLKTTPTASANRLSPAAFPVVTSTVDFAPDSFKLQVEAALRVPANERQTQTSTTTIRACVKALAGNAASPVLVESARYQGQPATLVVVRTGSGDTAWVAGSRCSATDHDVLDRTTVPSGISGP
jgi:hypothetical protein